ncbi:MAG: DUF1311 domain-containing protein [Sideroxydans sp.]|nr:DUF1311 domain-containing protein [Sideroxydans sp.]
MNRTVWFFLGWLMLIPLFAHANDDYPNTEWMGGQADKDSGWYKECIKVKDTSPPESDQPSAQISASLGSCIPTDQYYEAKRKVATDNSNWVSVKNCAFAQNDDRVLMMLYANGFGVSKNVNLAIKYACKIGGAPAEVEIRVAHLANMADDSEDRIFDLCDDITSGYMQGWCTSFEETQNTRERNVRLAVITGKMSQRQKESFGNLKNALSSYAKHVSDKETDTSGTGRAAFMIEAEAAELELFSNDLINFEKGNTPRFTSHQFDEYDKTLNQLYKEIMRAESMTEWSTRLGYTTITKEGVKITQKSWLKYRDAWVAFGQTKYPSVAPHSWKALLTERRIKTLEYLLDVAKNGL